MKSKLEWLNARTGSLRTRLLEDVQVVHHSKTYGRRYDVDGQHRQLVDELVETGRAKVLAFMKHRGASDRAIERFRNDKFDHKQSQKEVDQSTLERKSEAIRPPT